MLDTLPPFRKRAPGDTMAECLAALVASTAAARFVTLSRK
jgi:hypothetical protein